MQTGNLQIAAFRIGCSLLACCSAASALGDVFLNYPFSSVPAPEPFSVGPGTSLRSLLVTDDSKITVTGGSITNIQESLSWPAILLTDNAQADISAGEMRVHTRPGVTFGTSVLDVRDNGVMNISGGVFESFGGLDPVITAGRSVRISITGGRFIAHNENVIRMMFIGDNAVLTISGGEFVAVRASDVDLSLGDGTVNILAQEATLNGTPVAFGTINAEAGVLSLLFPNGMREDLSFRNSFGTINLIFVPEPSTMLVVLSGVGLASTARRRRMKA